MLISASGGFSYHLRAFRYRHSLWAPFHRELREWLTGWKPSSRQLVIIGSSGGYALSRQFLARFESVEAWDLDPLARRIFLWRHPGVRVRGVNALTSRGRFTPELLRESLPDGAAVLFTNVLGQLPYECRKGVRLDWVKLHRALEGREWATFHDRLSGYGRFGEWTGTWGSDAELSRGFTGANEVESHETESLWREGCSGLRYFDWQITPRRVHRIEGFFSG